MPLLRFRQFSEEVDIISEGFKICTSCTPRYQKPIGLKKRVCPTRGARGQYAFRKPTEDEVRDDSEKRSKREALIQKLVKEEFSQDEMEVANRTSRSAGAVSGKAIVPRYVEGAIPKHHDILDFGAGKDAVHAQNLRAKGFKVTAHEFGNNQKKDLHDPDALKKTYHTVYASNVLNTQSNPKMLSRTLDQIHGSIKPGGHFVGNLPSSPRKFEGLNHDLLHSELSKRFETVKRVGGTKQAPLFHATKKA